MKMQLRGQLSAATSSHDPVPVALLSEASSNAALQVVKAVHRAARATEKQHRKLTQQAGSYMEGLRIESEDRPDVSTARLAFEGVQAQYDIIRKLRELHVAELKVEVAQSELVS